MPKEAKTPHSAEIDELFGLPLAEFTPARDALATRLRAAGEGEAASAVKGLRKPTRAAWAVNQLARRHSDGVRELVALGEELRSAQAALLSGKGGEDLARLAERERSLVKRLGREARAILEEQGSASAATLDDVAETLHAAALDEDAGRAVAEGRLAKERRAIGLGLGAMPEGTASRRPARKDRAKAQPEPAQRKETAADRRRKAALEKARAESHEARRELAQAEARLADARRTMEAAQADLRRAERESRDAAKKAERAEARAAGFEPATSGSGGQRSIH